MRERRTRHGATLRPGLGLPEPRLPQSPPSIRTPEGFVLLSVILRVLPSQGADGDHASTSDLGDTSTTMTMMKPSPDFTTVDTTTPSLTHGLTRE